MKVYLFIFLVYLSFQVKANPENTFSNLIESHQENIDLICNETTLIDNKKFCIKESKITLNSCGRESDWPCLEDDGCLKIDTYIILENE